VSIDNAETVEAVHARTDDLSQRVAEALIADAARGAKRALGRVGSGAKRRT
jgi:hypothetical protein